MKPTHNDIADLMESACVSGLDDLVEYLTYDPIAEVWDQFGSFSNVSRSPRPGEYGYYVISEYTELLCLSFQLPFDRDGRLAGCGRVVLETREEELDARILGWDTSRAIWESWPRRSRTNSRTLSPSMIHTGRPANPITIC